MAVLHYTRPLACLAGLHAVGWAYVGTSWNPGEYVRACRRCGVGLYGQRWDRLAPYPPGTATARRRGRVTVLLLAVAVSALYLRAHRSRR